MKREEEEDMEELFYKYNPWWEEEIKLEGIIPRPSVISKMEEWVNNDQIVFLTGLRRVGKTTLLRLFIKKLIEEKGVHSKHVFYMSLDDYLIAHKSVLEIIEEYRKIQKIPIRDKVYLFLDEVAYKQNFEQELKNIYDSQNAKIYASSSSASILNTRKAYLTGRCFILEILPLDFEEFLLFKNIVIKKRDEQLKESYFEDYLKAGGMPEYILKGDIEYIRNLVDNVINKDIVAFHSVRDTGLVKDFFVLLMERSGKQISINKIANILKISPDTAKRYLQMFVDTYLIYVVPRWGKTNVKIMSPKKIYAADLGIKSLFTGFRDKGSFFENYVFLEIKHKKPFYVYENGIELDFFTSDRVLIEAKYHSDLNEKQRKLFENFKAKDKMIIRNIKELQHLKTL